MKTRNTGIAHHLIRREKISGSGKAIDGTILIPAIDLPMGHSPAKLRASRKGGRKGTRRGIVEGIGLVYREPKEGMMVEAKEYS